jgi:hypothetical protein
MDFLIPISTWLQQPELEATLHVKPKVIYKDFGSGSECVYTEMWTAKWWQKMYDTLPMDVDNMNSIPLVILPESDKTHLSKSGTVLHTHIPTFKGTHFAHCLVITLGNWSEEIKHSSYVRQDVAYFQIFQRRKFLQRVTNHFAEYICVICVGKPC